MIRYIACLKCGEQFHVHSEDVNEGWQVRKRTGKATRPSDFGVTVSGGGKSTFLPYQEMVCDICNRPMPDGSIVTAITMWRNEPEPDNWEKTEYSMEVT